MIFVNFKKIVFKKDLQSYLKILFQQPDWQNYWVFIPFFIRYCFCII